jgi:hypothetical protein
MRDSCWIGCLGGWLAIACTAPDPPAAVQPAVEPGVGMLAGSAEDGFVVGANDLPGKSPASSSELGGGCLAETRQAEAIRLDMFLMLDISGSMLDPLPAAQQSSLSTTKWDAVRGSLESFVQAPDAVDIGVGLQYFPQGNDGVPFACSSNAECGAGGPCTNSLCVSRGERAASDGGGTIAFLRASGDEGTLCSSDAECAPLGAQCRTMTGACVFAAGATPDDPAARFANVSDAPETSVVPALCSSSDDCQGVPLSRCEAVGLCSLAALQCTDSVGCPAGAGECLPFPYTCSSYTSCDTERYATPAVAISDAGDRSASVIASLRAQVPVGATPTGPALRGALANASLWASQHLDRQVVTVLATDGFPTVCEPLEIPDIAQLASDAAQGQRPVRTFVIGVFGTQDLDTDGRQRLDDIARAGGSERALVVNTAGNVAEDFLDALNVIRNTAVSCDFQLDATTGLDFERVNVLVTSADGTPTELSNVADRAACGNAAGWYYVRDDAGVPTQLSVCPATCTQLETERARVDLQIGCLTRIR